MSKKINKLFIRKLIFEVLNECSHKLEKQNKDKDFYYLAPNVIGSINNSNIDKEKNVFIVNFTKTDNTPLKFVSRPETFFNWAGSTDIKQDNNNISKFLKDFIQNKTDEPEGQLDEIIDDDGNLIGNNDVPSNATNSMVGLTKFDTSKVARQTLAKSKRLYTPYGIGYVVW